MSCDYRKQYAITTRRNILEKEQEQTARQETPEQVELFDMTAEEVAISALLKLKQRARALRQKAAAIERLVEELEDSINAEYNS